MAAGGGRYHICVKGHLDSSWSDWFGGLEIASSEHGDTHLNGIISDQAALYGILNHLAALGVTLISVTPMQTEKEVRHE